MTALSPPPRAEVHSRAAATHARTTTIDDALAVLLAPALEPIVELVLCCRRGVYEAHAVDGSVRFTRRDVGVGWEFDVVDVVGRNPLGDQSLDRFVGFADELANRFPTRRSNSYPYAYEQVAQVFDHPHAPDLVVLHTASHHWAEHGGHVGEHGSIDVVQARAPFVIGGRGVRRLGTVDRGARLIDVTATVAELLGISPAPDAVGLNGRPRPGALLGRQDGDVLVDLLDGDRPAHVLGFLLDGTNPNVLYEMIEAGELPHLARIAAAGTTFRHGAISSLPTVTLANHTTVLTGCHPGHHGILHNAWWDRARQRQIITNDASQWAGAMEHLAPGVETLHEALQRSQPGAFTASVNEPCDRGALFSTFDLIRRRVRSGFPKTPEGLPHTTERFVRPFKDYAWYSQVDHHGMEQAVGVLSGRYLGVDYPPPRFLWVNFTLTDSAFHEQGPHGEAARASLIDTDGRIGEILGVLDRQGRFDDCAFFVVADHGMEQSDPAVRGDWGEAMRAAGLDFRDEAYGFVYLNPGSRPAP